MFSTSVFDFSIAWGRTRRSRLGTMPCTDRLARPCAPIDRKQSSCKGQLAALKRIPA